jgi:oligopeptide transport system substrate-binding protein
VQVYGESWTDVGNIVTSGPFTLHKWQSGDRIVLKRNPAYRGSFTGNLEWIEFIISEDKEILLDLYEADELDIMLTHDLSPNARKRSQRLYAEEHLQTPWLQTEIVGFDTRRPPFDDLRVRQAFAMALDKEKLAQEGWKGLYSPATGGFVPPGMPGYTPVIANPYDPDRARNLLAEAGYSNGRSFPKVEALMRGPGVDWEGVQLIRVQLRENLGVDIPWKLVEPKVLYARQAKNPPHLWSVGMLAAYPDPYDFLGTGIARDWTRWEHEPFQRLVDKARQITDQAQRIALLQKADEILVKQAPLIPILYGRIHWLIKPWVQKYPMSAMDAGFYQHVVVGYH